MITIETNKELGFTYIRLRDTPVERTERISNHVLIDFDQQKEVVGIEVEE